jgi:hypothetical protein
MTSVAAAHSPTSHLLRQIVNHGAAFQHGHSRDHNTDHGNKNVVSLDAANNPDQTESGILYRADMCCDVLGHAKRIQNLMIPHSHTPYLKMRRYLNTTVENSTEHFRDSATIRFRAAPCVFLKHLPQNYGSAA